MDLKAPQIIRKKKLLAQSCYHANINESTIYSTKDLNTASSKHEITSEKYPHVPQNPTHVNFLGHKISSWLEHAGI